MQPLSFKATNIKYNESILEYRYSWLTEWKGFNTVLPREYNKNKRQKENSSEESVVSNYSVSLNTKPYDDEELPLNQSFSFFHLCHVFLCIVISIQ